MSDDDLTDRIMASEVTRLQREVDDLRAQLGRPVGVTVSQVDSPVMMQIGTYLPQLTMLATNTSMVASAIQTQNNLVIEQNKILDRIAKHLEGKAP